MGAGIKRNLPCFCASGLKYKHCHYLIESGFSPKGYRPIGKLTAEEQKRRYGDSHHSDGVVADNSDAGIGDTGSTVSQGTGGV